MARSDIGIVLQDDVAFLAADVGLVVDDGISTAWLAVLADHDQARIESWLDSCLLLSWRRTSLIRVWPIGRGSSVLRPSDQARATKLAERHLRRVAAVATRADMGRR
jgi:hypothetical protein